MTRAGGSLGLFDLVAVGPGDVRLIQVKAGTSPLRSAERAVLVALPVPSVVHNECWRYPDRCRDPLVEHL